MSSFKDGTIGTIGIRPLIFTQSGQLADPIIHVAQPLLEAPPTTQPSIFAHFYCAANYSTAFMH